MSLLRSAKRKMPDGKKIDDSDDHPQNTPLPISESFDPDSNTTVKTDRHLSNQ
jgi:hypothetical protein